MTSRSKSRPRDIDLSRIVSKIQTPNVFIEQLIREMGGDPNGAFFMQSPGSDSVNCWGVIFCPSCLIPKCLMSQAYNGVTTCQSCLKEFELFVSPKKNFCFATLTD